MIRLTVPSPNSRKASVRIQRKVGDAVVYHLNGRLHGREVAAGAAAAEGGSARRPGVHRGVQERRRQSRQVNSIIRGTMFDNNTEKPRYNESEGTKGFVLYSRDFVIYSRDFVIAGYLYYEINYRRT
jgi:hypothetical protein